MPREREPGESPGLTRSGMQERPPSSALVAHDWEATAIRSTARCVPASPKTCRLCRARRAWRLTASWNRRSAATVVYYRASAWR
jgi:5-methyltetrahydropteroyltriglutamate--homocysteine methyltransferase